MFKLSNLEKIMLSLSTLLIVAHLISPEVAEVLALILMSVILLAGPLMIIWFSLRTYVYVSSINSVKS